MKTLTSKAYEATIYFPVTEYGPEYVAARIAISGLNKSYDVRQQIIGVADELLPEHGDVKFRKLSIINRYAIEQRGKKSNEPAAKPFNVGGLVAQYTQIELASPPEFYN